MTTIAEILLHRPGSAANELTRLFDKRIGALGLARYGLVNATRHVANAVAAFLAMPIGNVVLSAWDKHHAVRSAYAQTAGRPGASANVVVAEHTLEISQRPQVLADIVGQHIHILDVVLSLTLHIDSVVVTVYEGRFNGCQPGTASATAELGVALPGGETQPLMRRELASVSLQPVPPVEVAVVA